MFNIIFFKLIAWRVVHINHYHPTPQDIDTHSSSGDILGDLPPDASEEEIQSRLAAAGIDPETAKSMAGAVRGGGGRKFGFFRIFSLILSTSGPLLPLCNAISGLEVGMVVSMLLTLTLITSKHSPLLHMLFSSISSLLIASYASSFVYFQVP